MKTISFLEKIFAIIFWCPILAANYYYGAAAIFANHPSYLKVLIATTIFVTPVALTMKSGEKSDSDSEWAAAIRHTGLVAIAAWVFKLVEIIPNPPF